MKHFLGLFLCASSARVAAAFAKDRTSNLLRSDSLQELTVDEFGKIQGPLSSFGKESTTTTTVAQLHFDQIPMGTSKPEEGVLKPCGLHSMPPPVLEGCTDPITSGKADLTGFWVSETTKHWERIEQCADRVTVSGPGEDNGDKTLYFIHDFLSANGTEAGGCKDYNTKMFPKCVPISPSGILNSTCMVMTTKIGPIEGGATRCLNPDGTMTFFNTMIGEPQVMRRASAPPDSTTTTTVAGQLHFDQIPMGTSKPEEGVLKPCGLHSMPPPVLEGCTDPITSGKANLTGIWVSETTKHWERIEQCADRVTVSGPGEDNGNKTLYFIHDFLSANGTEAGGCKDYNTKMFPQCVPISPSGILNSTCMVMTTKIGPIEGGATRCLNPDGTLTFFNTMIGEPQVMRRADSPP